MLFRSPNESWDYDNVAQITTADLEIHGQKRHVVMQAPKNGFFYVLDARSGELLSADPYVADVNWASGVDLKTGRPKVNPAANYSKTGKGAFVSPFYGGAHLWPPMSFSPKTGLMYIPARDRANMATVNESAEFEAGKLFTGGSFPAIRDRPPTGLLAAVDPSTGKVKWQATTPTWTWSGTLATAPDAMIGPSARTCAGNSSAFTAAFTAE